MGSLVATSAGKWDKRLQQFVRKLRPYLHGIAASAKNRALEDINNKIKSIKRMEYGYRDTEYFF